MAWEWEMWRCFDSIKETFEEKGWESEGGRMDNGVMPLLAEFGDYCIAFFKRDPCTSECWFELRDKVRGRMVFVQGVQNIPTPQLATKLLADYGRPSYEITPLADRPIHGLPVAPVGSVVGIG